MKKLFIAVAIWLLMMLAFCAGHWLRPDIGMGIYFEDGRLVADGGRQSGVKFNGNVDITLPDWIKDTLGGEPNCWQDSTIRNFHFDFTGDDPNDIKIDEGNVTIKNLRFVETLESDEPNEVIDANTTSLDVVFDDTSVTSYELD